MASNSQCLRERKLVLVGKTGSGKSSLGNTFFEEKVFETDGSPSSETTACKSATKEVMDTQLTLIDTPGLLDTKKSEEDLRSVICRCISECAPGVHAFLIVLKVERFTKHEEEVITEIIQYFSEEVLKYSVIVFTHGDQLNEGTTIQQFVDQNQKLKNLVRKCDGRCHVFDSRYWKNNNPEEKYRSNSYQLEELLITVENLLAGNSCYTNKMLQEVDRQIQRVEKSISKTEGNLSSENRRERAKNECALRHVTIMQRSVSLHPLSIFFGSRIDEFYLRIVETGPTPISRENVVLIQYVREDHLACHVL